MDLSQGGNSAHQGDLIITAGQDSKVKVWNLCQLLSTELESQNEAQRSQPGCYHEFSEHTGAVTCVRFSYGASLLRAFSSSVDKTFRVYDLPSRTTLKQIQMPASILRFEVDQIESSVFLACDNLNVYQVPLQGSS